jgi:hypothetical protein
MVVQRVRPLHRWTGRAVGIDLHRDFCEVAICEDGVVRSAGRVRMAPEGIEALAAGLEPTDRVAMGVSGGAWEVARMLEPHVERVVVVWPDDTGIVRARTKTDSSMPARWRAFCGGASLRRCGCPTSAPACSGGGWRAASSWSARALG